MLAIDLSTKILWWGLGLELLFLALLAFLSGAEAAILAASKLRARHNAELGVAGAEAVVELHGKKQDFLPAILAIETLLTVGISTLGTAIAQLVHPGTHVLIAAALFITLIILVF